MFIRLILVLIITAPFYCSAQKRDIKIDSLEVVLKQNLTNEKRIEIYKRLCGIARFYDNKKHKIYLDSLIDLATRVDSLKYKATLARQKAGYYNSISEYEMAEVLYKEAIAEFYKLGQKKRAHDNLRFLSKVQRRLGHFEDAMESAMQALKEKETLGLKDELLAKDYGRVAAIHGDLKNIVLADSYFKKAEAIYLRKNNTKALAGLWMNLGLIQGKLKHHDSALAYFRKAEMSYAEREQEFNLASVNINIGSAYKNMNDLDSAAYYYKKALKIGRENNFPVKITAATNSLGNISRAKGNHEQALVYYKEALRISKKIKTKKSIAGNYYNIARTYASLKNYKEAYKYRELHFKVYDSVFKKETLEKVNQLEVQYQTEKKEKALLVQEGEINKLNQRVKVSNLTKSIYGIGMFSFLAIAGLLYFGFKQRIKKNRIAREKQEAIYKQEIEFKKKELTSQTMHLVQKNSFIQELKENLEKIRQSPELFKVEFRRLITLLKKENAEDKDWEIFKSYFSEVHNDFDIRIKELNTDITEKEIRLAAFLRMNLTTKEIATMLNVLPDSVKKSKYRLKVKLGLGKGQELISFLSSL